MIISKEVITKTENWAEYRDCVIFEKKPQRAKFINCSFRDEIAPYSCDFERCSFAKIIIERRGNQFERCHISLVETEKKERKRTGRRSRGKIGNTFFRCKIEKYIKFDHAIVPINFVDTSVMKKLLIITGYRCTNTHEIFKAAIKEMNHFDIVAFDIEAEKKIYKPEIELIEFKNGMPKIISNL